MQFSQNLILRVYAWARSLLPGKRRFINDYNLKNKNIEATLTLRTANVWFPFTSTPGRKHSLPSKDCVNNQVASNHCHNCIFIIHCRKCLMILTCLPLARIEWRGKNKTDTNVATNDHTYLTWWDRDLTSKCLFSKSAFKGKHVVNFAACL